jgi:nucleotide-binding universal stress UspA family protein
MRAHIHTTLSAALSLPSFCFLQAKFGVEKCDSEKVEHEGRRSDMAFKRILCAVDFSESSLEAFQQAIELARLGASEVYVLHVIEAQPVVPALIQSDEVGEMAVTLEEKATAALDSLLSSSASLLEGVPLKAEVTSGRAITEILNHALEWGVDLIALGAKGATSLDQIVIGGTAENVMKDAPCSTLIVRSTSLQRYET